MNREIGSDFWRQSVTDASTRQLCAPAGFDVRGVLCGRTAQQMIVQDIICSRGRLKSVYMPSYCCHTMLEPFAENGVTISFYDVFAGKDKIECDYDVDNGCDAVFLMNYFGFTDTAYAERIKAAAQRGQTVIIDRTQEFLCELTNVQLCADYIFESPRKWFAANAAVVMKKGSFKVEDYKKIHTAYLDLRHAAALEKYDYIFNGKGDKQAFLSKFSAAEQLLEAEHGFYTADAASVAELAAFDRDAAVKSRRDNARYLIDELLNSGLEGIRPAFTGIGDGDCPLFVPVIVDEQIRAALRSSMTAKDIYCPLHWQLSPLHTLTDRAALIYAQEMSLICDQRYTLSDMERQMLAVKSFFEENINA